MILQGPNKLAFNTSTALNDIYHNERLRKSQSYLVTQQQGRTLFNVFNELDRDLHRYKRKLVGKCVSDRFLQQFEPTRLEHIDILIKQFHKKSATGNPVNATFICKRFGFDFVSQLGLGSH